MLFPKRQQILREYSGTPGFGNTINFSITRDFFIDSLLVVQPVSINFPTGTRDNPLTAYGLWNIFKNVQLQIADGSSNRNQTDASSASLIRYASQVLNGLDFDTIKGNGIFAKWNSVAAATDNNPINGTYYIVTPLLFKHPQLSDPIGSAFLLPAPRYNTNPLLRLTYNTESALTPEAGSGYLSVGQPYVIVNRRQVDNIEFPTLLHEFQEQSQSFASTGTNMLMELQVPGSYTCLDFYTTNNSGTPQEIITGLNSLQYLGNVIRQFNFRDLYIENDYSRGNDLYRGLISQVSPASSYTAPEDLTPAYAHMDFLHDGFGMEVGELGSVMNTNLLAGSGSRLQLLLSIGAVGTVNIFWQRVFGNLAPYTLNFKPQS